MLRAARALLAISMATTLSSATVAATIAAAQPRVVVRAGTRIELGVRRGPDELVIQGTVRDDLGTPLPDRPVTLAAHEARPDGAVGPSLARAVARSGSDGVFSTRFPLPLGRYVLVAHIDDEAHYRGETVTRLVQLDLAPVRLDVALEGGPRLDLERERQRLDVRAISEAGGADLTITVRDELDRELASGVTAEDGSLALELASAALGSPSVGRLFVESRSDARRADARTEVPVVRYRSTAIEIGAPRTGLEAGEATTVRGTLRAGEAPLPSRAVGLFDGQHHLGTTLTGEDGGFELPLEAESLEAGEHAIVARFESDAPWLSSSESSPLLVAVSVPGATPWGWLVASVLVTGLGLGIATLRPRRDRSRGPEASGVLPAPGLLLAQRRSLLADVHEISGTVVDAVLGEPIAGARVRGSREGRELFAVATDVAGAFVVEASGGALVLEIDAPGYEAARHRASAPHRGEWRGLVVRLQSLRDAAWGAMRAVVQRVVGSEGAEAATAREVIAAAKKKPPVPEALPGLAARVEAATWGPALPSADEVGAIRDAARDTLADLDS